jgi:hypothetical protein
MDGLRHLVRVLLDRDAERSTEAEVGDLQALRLVVHEQVLRLEVAVHYAVLVTVRYALDQLIHEALRGAARVQGSGCVPKHGKRQAEESGAS